MNRSLEAIKNSNMSKEQKAKAIMGHFGEEVGKKVLERIYNDRTYNILKNWFASIDMTYKLDDKIITVDMKYQTLWQKANAISLKWSQYWAKFYKKKLPSEYIFITAPFYNDNGEPEYHKHMYKLWIMMSDDMTMYRNKLKTKEEPNNPKSKRFTIPLPSDTIDNFKPYFDSTYIRNSEGYLNPRLLINEIATLNEEEIKKLKEIQFVLHDLGIRNCVTAYGKNKNGFYKKEAS
jgi:hypothetical protein|tara:strand:- start:902 stop:1603 length:702 start_codon:yes stop_codon:yes gene_type:complete